MKQLTDKNQGIRLWITLIASVFILIATYESKAQCTSPAYDLDQGRNGKADAPVNPIDWVNGNLNESHSHYVEGYSIPYRAVITELDSGQCYCIQIEYDIKHSDVNAIDYLTSFPNCTNELNDDPSHLGSFMHGAECVNPLDSVDIVDPTVSYYNIPAPTHNILALGNMQPLTSYQGKDPDNMKFTMFNGLLTSADYDVEGDLTEDKDATSMIICFVAQGETAVLAWGGHIASRLDWGIGNSAGNISGSPYHMRILGAKCCSATAFSGGNQDRSLQAKAVIPAPVAIIAGLDSTCANGENTHMITTNQPGVTTYEWTITDLGTTGAQIVGSDSSQQVNISTTGTGEYVICGTIFVNGQSASVCDTITVLGNPVCGISGDDLVCNGGSTTFTASGGANYLWSTGATTADIEVSLAGTYTVTVTNEFGCSASCDKDLTAGIPFSLGLNVTDVACFGDNSGSIDLVVSGGSQHMTFAWSNNEVTEDISGLAAGTYTVTVSDENGCSLSDFATVNQPEAALDVAGIPSDASCNGGTDGSIELTVTGGTEPYSFDWSDGPDTEDRSDLGAGTYNVIVTDAHGCTDDISVTVEEPSALAIEKSQENVACNGGNTGSIDISVSGGTPDFSYLWNDNETSEDRSGLVAGVYTVTVTDENGCSAEKTIEITQAGSLSAEVSKTEVSCFEGSNGEIVLEVSGGTPGYSFLWNDNETAEDRTGLPAGTYTVTITDANGCSLVESEEIIQPDQLTASVQSGNVSCNGGSNGFIQLTVNGGTEPYSFNWNNGFSDLEDLENLSAGIYSVVITDFNGCTKESGAEITEPEELVIVSGDVIDVACKNGSDGSIDITVSGGTPEYQFSWNTGANTEDLLEAGAGNYTVLVTDAQGCTATDDFVVDEPSLLESSATPANVTCKGNANGSIEILVSGGTPEYSYEWSNGADVEDLSGLEPGTYTLTVTDSHGCTAVATAEITEPAALELLVSVENETCNESNNGSINIGVVGGTPGYTFEWSNGAATEDIENLEAGTYTVTVTDNNGCSVSESREVTQPDVLAISGSASDASCNGTATGVIDISVSGGTGLYTFLWNNNEVSEDLSSLAAGSYTVTVTDENGCSASESYTVNSPDALGAGTSVSDLACNGVATGAIDLSVSGGTPDYSFLWNNGALTEDLANIGAGTYTVTITDANGCSLELSVSVEEPAALVIDVNGECSPCKKPGEAYATVSASGGTGNLSILWSNGETTATISNLASGIYTVTVTDENGCSASDEVLLDCDAKCQFTTYTMGGWGADPNGHNPGTYLHANFAAAFPNGLSIGCNNTLSLSGAQDVTNFLPSGSTASQLPVGNLLNPGGSYSNVLAGQLVAATLSITFDLYDPGFSPELGNLADLEISAGDFAGWTLGQLVDSANAFIGGCGSMYSESQFNVALSDLNENFDNGDENHGFVLCPSEELYGYIVKTDVSCDKACDGTAQVVALEGTAPYSYVWSNGETSDIIKDLCEGTYTVTVTDANGCIYEVTVTIEKKDVEIDLFFTVFDASCYGAGNGSIDLIVSGGNAPYQYTWSNGETTEDISNLDATTYTVTVYDDKGCPATGTVLVSEPEEIILDIKPIHVSCDKKGDGAADLSVSGGTGPYTFLWSNGADSEDIAGQPAGTYTVTVTDANDCVVTGTVTILEMSASIDIIATPTDVNCSEGSDGSIVLVVNGGAQPYGFLWSNGATTQNLSGLIAGTYTVTVTDANGCSNSAEAIVGEPDELETGVSIGNPVCGINGSVNLTVSGGTAPYTYLWSNGKVTEDISGLQPSTYTVTVTDAHGCTSKISALVPGPRRMNIKLKAITHSTENDCNGAIDIGITGGTPPLTYQWTTGATTQDVHDLCPGMYRVRVFDSQGCMQRRWFTINQLDEVAVRLDAPLNSISEMQVVNVYPSPATEQATIQLQVPVDGMADIAMFDMIGKEVMSQSQVYVSAGYINEIVLEVNHLNNGIYLVNIMMNGKVVTTKLHVGN